MYKFIIANTQLARHTLGSYATRKKKRIIGACFMLRNMVKEMTVFYTYYTYF